VILRHQKSNFGRLAPEIPLTLAFLEEDGVMLEVRLQYGGQAVQANAELFGRRGEVVRFLSENGEATQKQIAEELQLNQSSVSRLIKQLIAEGIVEEVPDTNHPKRYRLKPQTGGGGVYAFMQPLKGVHKCINGDSAEPLPDLPAVFQNRTPLVWDLVADWLQSGSNPEDPFPLEPTELEAIRVMLAYAEARGFPSLEVDGYTIRGDMAGWEQAAKDLRGLPAVARATRMLHALDASGTPHAPTHNTTLRNGDASRTPSQLSLEEI
jgi:DNA-binding transcriptional ArsR family regulator